MTPSMLLRGLRTVAGVGMLTATPAALAVNQMPVPPAFAVRDDPVGGILYRMQQAGFRRVNFHGL